ncbi:MAG: DUF4270 family protein [Ginsengibacter sp.]
MFKDQYKAAVRGMLIIFFFAIGCTKIDTTTIGQNLIPGVDNIHTFDTTFAVIATNFDNNECDTAQRSDLQALGIINNDPYFGKTNAKIYVELKPASFPYAFPAADPDSLLLDSAVIVLKYSYTFGDTTVPQKVKIYHLLDSFRLGDSYTTCRELGYDKSVLLGERSFLPLNLNDSIHAINENVTNQLRIPLSNSFAQQLIRDSAQVFKNDNDFVKYFKGFAIVPDESVSGQGLNYFDIDNKSTRLSLYVRSSKSGVKDTSRIDFTLTGRSALSNSVIRDRANAEMTHHLTHPPEGDSLIYIQTSPGTYAMLTIPGLTGLSNRVINRAELIVDQVYSSNSLNDIFATPVSLYIDTKDPDINGGAYIPIPCDFSTAELQSRFAHLGGGVKQSKDDQGNLISEYVFNISRYLQSIVTKGKPNLNLRLSAPNYINNLKSYVDWCGQSIVPFTYPKNTMAYGRVKLNGTNNTTTRLRLRVIYSVL